MNSNPVKGMQMMKMQIERALLVVLIVSFQWLGCHSPIEPKPEKEQPEWQAVNNGLDFTAVNDLKVNRVDPAQLYTGTMRNFYKTSDSGEHWQAKSSELSSTYIYCIAFDPVDVNRIYCGTKLGVSMSPDAGEKWGSLAGEKTTCTITSLSISENGTIWAGTLTGLVSSEDQGDTWSFCDIGLYERIGAVAVQPGQPNTVLVSVRYQGIYRTWDNGKNWTKVNNGLYSESWGFDHASQFLYNSEAQEWWMVTVRNDVYRSVDPAAGWTRVGGKLAEQKIVSLAIDPADNSRMWAASLRNGVWATSDGGQSWSVVGSEPPTSDATAVCYAGGEKPMLFLGTFDAGIYRLSGF